MKQKLRFIINPKSGVSQKNDLPALIASTINDRQFEYDIVRTKYAEHARELTREAMRSGVDIICAVGGDGSVHEVGTELIGTKTKLAILPAGSGNGLARHLNLPLNLEEAIHRINNGKEFIMDTVTVNNEAFLNVGGFGFDALIAKKFESYKNRGFWGYAKLISKEYFSFKPNEFEIEINGKTIHEEFVLCTVANASEFGNGLCISPHSKVDDGQLEMCLLSPFPSIKTPSVLYKLFTRKNDLNQHARIIPFKQARITLHNNMAHFDGEPKLVNSPIELSVNPKSLTVIV